MKTTHKIYKTFSAFETMRLRKGIELLFYIILCKRYLHCISISAWFGLIFCWTRACIYQDILILEHESNVLTEALAD